MFWPRGSFGPRGSLHPPPAYGELSPRFPVRSRAPIRGPLTNVWFCNVYGFGGWSPGPLLARSLSSENAHSFAIRWRRMHKSPNLSYAQAGEKIITIKLACVQMYKISESSGSAGRKIITIVSFWGDLTHFIFTVD